MTFGRDLVRGSLDLMALSFISQGECYGYQILAGLRERSGGRIDLKAGTLYPILHKLQDDGCLTARWEPGVGRERKWYSITPRGREQLAREAREWLDYADCVRGLLGPQASKTGSAGKPATT